MQVKNWTTSASSFITIGFITVVVLTYLIISNSNNINNQFVHTTRGVHMTSVIKKVNKEDKSSSTPIQENFIPDYNDVYAATIYLISTSPTNNYILNIGNFGYVNATFFIDGNLVHKFETGRLLELSEKEVATNLALIPLKLEPDTKYRLELICRNYLPQFHEKGFQFTLKTNEEYIRETHSTDLIQSLFIGGLIVMSLYNLFLFMSVKDNSYLFYVISITGYGLYFLFYYGLGFSILWPNHPTWDAYCFGLIIPITSVSRIYFTKYYLIQSINGRNWNRLLATLSVLYLVPSTISIWSMFYGPEYIGYAILFIAVLGNIVLLLMLLSGIFSYANGYVPARFFVVANVFFVLGSMLFIMRELNAVPDNLITKYASQTGILIQMTLFSLGLADRLNRTQMELAKQKQHEAELAKKQEIEERKRIQIQKEQLKVLVDERTVDLKNKTSELQHSVVELRHTQAELRRLNRIKDKVFSLIGHDLKAPLATFDSFLNILLNHKDELAQTHKERLINSTKTSLQSINILLDNLLKWSGTQLTEVKTNPENIDLNKALEETIQLFDFALHAKNLDLIYAPTSEHFIIADKNMIYTVVRNLINNAIKFTPKGERIHISLEENGNNIVLSVFNSNTNIHDGLLSRIRRFDGQYKTKGTDNEEGYGLGLMLCNEFVQVNGGKLRAEVIKGEGIVFSVILPMAERVKEIV